MADKLLLFTHQPTLLEINAADQILGEVNDSGTTIVYNKTKKAFVYTMVGTSGFRLTHSRAFDINEIHNFSVGALSVRVLPAGVTLLASAKEILNIAADERETVTHKFSAGETLVFVTGAGVTKFNLIVRENTDYLTGAK